MQFFHQETQSKLVWPHESVRKQFGENRILGFYNQRKNRITRDVNQGHTKIPVKEKTSLDFYAYIST